MTYQYHIGYPLVVWNFPKDTTEANECWEQIKDMLAQEWIYEDGELSEYEAEEKYKGIMEDAKCLHASYPMPVKVRENIEFWLDPVDENYFI